MNPLLNALLALGFLVSPTPALADTIVPLQYSTTTAPTIIEAYAVRYGIPARSLVDTLRCESGFDANAVGDFGTSYGLAQIHLPAHPDITKAEALNPYFAIDFAARSFANHKESMWSCWNNAHARDS